MTEFDELKRIECVQGLLRERGQKRTAESVRAEAGRLANANGTSLEAALEAMEDDLLSSPPDSTEGESHGH